MKPICVPCQRFYRCKRNGFRFVEAMPIAGERRPPAGTEAPDLWEPYKLWVGDLWRCEGCGHELVSGFGAGAIAEHYQPDFAEAVQRSAELLGVPALLQVNDC